MSEFLGNPVHQLSAPLFSHCALGQKGSGENRLICDLHYISAEMCTANLYVHFPPQKLNIFSKIGNRMPNIIQHVPIQTRKHIK